MQHHHESDLAPPPTTWLPAWIGMAVGALIAIVTEPFALWVTVPLGFAIGVAIRRGMVQRSVLAHLQRTQRQLAERVTDLAREVAELQAQRRFVPTPETAPAQAAPPPAALAVRAEPAVAAAPAPATATAPRLPPRPAERVEPRSPSTPPVPGAIRRPPTPSALERAVDAARAWLFGGNTVARIGVLVLFVGVAFLLRYVAERTQVPIELRLLGVAAGALALLGLGWRMRTRRPGYAVTLQGGAIGILYLTAFAALRLYDVLTPLPAFAFMAALAVLSGALAVLQDARALAALGAAGGYLAPILVSTGDGRVALLFSYYLLLNLGVVGVAWFRAWRELNWIGFLFTFGVGGLWAVQRYTAADYAVGQGFLAAFWALFFVVSLLYALRQRGDRRGLFDTTLVFALPLVAFGIQTRFTQGEQLALAAVVAAAVYLAASAALLRRREPALRLLTEAVFGIGVGFLTLAVPLAASAQWTAAAWALEGVALLWVGLRQQRALPVLAGLALHAAGAVALAQALGRGDVSWLAEFSGFTVNLAVFAACAFASAALLRRSPHAPWGEAWRAFFAWAPWLAQLLAWGWVAALIWQPLRFPWYALLWCALVLVLLALDRRAAAGRAVSPEWVAGVVLVLLAALVAFGHPAAGDSGADWTLVLRLAVAATGVAAALLSLHDNDGPRRMAAAGLLTLGVLAWLAALLAEALGRVETPLEVAQLGLMLVGATAFALGWLGTRLRWDWPQRLAWGFFAAHLTLAAYVVTLAVATAVAPGRYLGWAVWPAAWLAFYLRLHAESKAVVKLPASGAVHVAGLWLLTSMLAAEVALQVDRVAGDGWFHGAWGQVLAAALWIVVQHASRWPMRAAPFAYARVGAPGLAAASLGWLLFANLWCAGDPAPLPALPIANPLDIASIAVLAALLRWHLADARPAWHGPVRAALAAAAFFVLNAVALRAVHFLAGVDWSLVALGRSAIAQTVLSLLWTSTALVAMRFAHRRGGRRVWFAGAGLLALVVAKLFFVDLSGQGAIERIVSFVGVGLLILLIGYLAPVPPAGGTGTREEGK
ncbi:MAG: DUF2339 domain-containing protein [Betaproteobacteria bacterium]